MNISTKELVRRNTVFAAGGGHAGLPFPSNQILRVVGCVDSRVDPSDVLGLALGDAVVMRNIGGRITPEALRAWALLGRLGQDGLLAVTDLGAGRVIHGGAERVLRSPAGLPGGAWRGRACGF